VFLGVSLECARCHDHPSERWRRDDFIGFAAFFSQVSGKGKRFPPPEAIYYVDFEKPYRHPESKQIVLPRFLGGGEPILRTWVDRRILLSDWMNFAGESLVRSCHCK
jgi:hypothetical protein